MKSTSKGPFIWNYRGHPNKYLNLSLLAVLSASFPSAVAQMQINTPNAPTQCVPAQFTWTGGTSPYFLALASEDPYGGPALQSFAGLTGTSFTWSANISAGTSFRLILTDSGGQTNQSAPVTIQSGPDSSCLDIRSSSRGAPVSSGSVTSLSTVTPVSIHQITVPASTNTNSHPSQSGSDFQSSSASSLISTQVYSGENTPGTTTVSNHPTTVSSLPITQSKGLPASVTGGIDVGATLLVMLAAVLSCWFKRSRGVSLCRRRLRKRSGS